MIVNIEKMRKNQKIIPGKKRKNKVKVTHRRLIFDSSVFVVNVKVTHINISFFHIQFLHKVKRTYIQGDLKEN